MKLALAIAALGLLLGCALGAAESALTAPARRARIEPPRRCEHSMTGAKTSFWFPCTVHDDAVLEL